MLTRIGSLATLTFASLILVGITRAQLTPAAGVEDLHILFSEADLACSGYVVDVSEVGSANQPTISSDSVVKDATVTIRRCYKPPANPGSVRVRFSEPADRLKSFVVSSSASLQHGEYALLFLKREGDVYVLSDKFFGKLPMAPELAPRAGTSGLDLLERDLVKGLEDDRMQFVEKNLQLLGALGTVRSTATAKIQQLADGPDSAISSSALLTLLLVHDYSRLGEALNLMERNGLPAPLTLKQREMGMAFERINDRSVVPLLLRFADSPSALVRGAVVRALRQLDDPRSVPALIRRLDDPAFFVRYDAVFTLAAIEGRQNALWSPGLPEYKEHESTYLAKWRNWWLTEGQQQFPGP